MKLKKIASLMLAGIMAVSMLAGCKGESNSNSTPNQPETPVSTGIVASVEGALKVYAPDEKVTVKTNDLMTKTLTSKIVEKYTWEAINAGLADSDYGAALASVFGDDIGTVSNETFADDLADELATATDGDVFYSNIQIPVEKVYGTSAQDFAAAILAASIGVLQNTVKVSSTDYNVTYTLYVAMENVKKADGGSVPFMVAVMEASVKKA